MRTNIAALTEIQTSIDVDILHLFLFHEMLHQGQYIHERGSKNGKRVQCNMVRDATIVYLFIYNGTHTILHIKKRF